MSRNAPDDGSNDPDFLTDYRPASSARLETGLIVGQWHRDKFDRAPFRA